MQFQYQLIKEHVPSKGRHGDCFRTCIAILLGLEPIKVPHFVELEAKGKGNADALADAWLRQKGYRLLSITLIADDLQMVRKVIQKFTNSIPYILTGASLRHEGVSHCVVALDGDILWCPILGDSLPAKELSPWEQNGQKYWTVEMIVKPIEE